MALDRVGRDARRLSLTRENALHWSQSSRPGARRAEPDSDNSRWSDARRQLAPFVLGARYVLLPVAVRNYAVGGGFYLTTSQFGTIFILGTTRARMAPPDRSWADAARRNTSGRTPSIRRTRHRAHAQSGEVSSYWTGQAVDYITSQPGSWLKLMARKFALLWNRAEAFDTESQGKLAEWSTPLRFLGPLGHFGILVPLACFGVWVTWPARSRLWILYVWPAPTPPASWSSSSRALPFSARAVPGDLRRGSPRAPLPASALAHQIMTAAAVAAGSRRDQLADAFDDDDEGGDGAQPGCRAAVRGAAG